MNWTVANDKYCLENWRVYGTPEGWRISHRKYKELPNFTELPGLIFETSEKALAMVERLVEREKATDGE